LGLRAQRRDHVNSPLRWLVGRRRRAARQHEHAGQQAPLNHPFHVPPLTESQAPRSASVADCYIEPTARAARIAALWSVLIATRRRVIPFRGGAPAPWLPSSRKEM